MVASHCEVIRSGPDSLRVAPIVLRIKSEVPCPPWLVETYAKVFILELKSAIPITLTGGSIAGGVTFIYMMLAEVSSLLHEKFKRDGLL
jgi:hypothetical protein